MNTPPDLSKARLELAAAAARLRRLKRTAVEPPKQKPRLAYWAELRLLAQSLREFFSAFVEPGQAGEPDPATAGEREELESRAERAETALADAERLQREADEKREAALAELERVREGWRLLRSDSRASLAPGEKDLAAALTRVQALLVAGERALDEERRAQRDAEDALRAWSWIVEVAFPSFEERAVSADGLLLLPTLRRLIQELDHHWKAARNDWRTRLSAMDAAPNERRSENAVFERALAQTDAERSDRLGELERVTRVWKAEVDSLKEALELYRGTVEPERRKLRERAEWERQRANGFAARFKFAAQQVAKLRALLTGKPEAGALGSEEPPAPI